MVLSLSNLGVSVGVCARWLILLNGYIPEHYSSLAIVKRALMLKPDIHCQHIGSWTGLFVPRGFLCAAVAVVGGTAADDFGIVGSVVRADADFVGMGAAAVFLDGSIAAAVAVAVGIDSAGIAANDPPAAVAAATADSDVANGVAFVEASQTLPRPHTRLRCDFCQASTATLKVLRCIFVGQLSE